MIAQKDSNELMLNFKNSNIITCQCWMAIYTFPCQNT